MKQCDELSLYKNISETIILHFFIVYIILLYRESGLFLNVQLLYIWFNGCFWLCDYFFLSSAVA